MGNRFLVVVAAAFSFGGVCGPPGPPPPDRCPSPVSRAVSEVALGPDIVGDRPFENWADDDRAYVTAGVQGGYMLGVVMRFSSDAPECIPQDTVVRMDGQTLASEDAPLHTYDAGDGTRKTRTTWLVFEDTGPPVGSVVEVRTAAGKKTTSQYVLISEDRHGIDSLTLLTAAPRVGYPIEFELKSHHGPAYESFTPTFSTTGFAISVQSPMYVYDDTMRIMGTAVAAGTSDYSVKFRDKELTVTVTVAP